MPSRPTLALLTLVTMLGACAPDATTSPDADPGLSTDTAPEPVEIDYTVVPICDTPISVAMSRDAINPPARGSEGYSVPTQSILETMAASFSAMLEGELESRVRFRQEDEGPIIERPLHKWRRVRDTGGHESMRPVIRTTLEMASFDFDVEMCLADRSRMRHRLILGRNFLRLGFIINGSLTG